MTDFSSRAQYRELAHSYFGGQISSEELTESFLARFESDPIFWAETCYQAIALFAVALLQIREKPDERARWLRAALRNLVHELELEPDEHEVRAGLYQFWNPERYFDPAELARHPDWSSQILCSSSTPLIPFDGQVFPWNELDLEGLLRSEVPGFTWRDAFRAVVHDPDNCLSMVAHVKRLESAADLRIDHALHALLPAEHGGTSYLLVIPQSLDWIMVHQLEEEGESRLMLLRQRKR